MAKASKKKRYALVGAWILFSIGLIAWLGYSMFNSEDKTVFLPGPLTSGHHQIGVACVACHTDDMASDEDIQKACVDCHGEDRKKPFDSHPINKFKDPRNADKLKNIDATLCITCHTEHQPDMTGENGLTQPGDFCIHCHEDIGEDRPSHKEMEFNTCNSSGCHNFHNNRSLYTDFLVKHLDEPKILPKRILPKREYASLLDEVVEYPRQQYPIKQLSKQDIDAPNQSTFSQEIHDDWLQTAHARSGVNCTACHQPVLSNDKATEWTDKPKQDVCTQCHSNEVKRFKKGKHGMRLAVDLPPMKPIDAQLPMKGKAAHEELTCISCHGAHRFDVQEAAVTACLNCHDDKHSLAYKESPHSDLWNKELIGEAPAGSGVSCSSCHMPRINFDVSEWTTRILVDHNQSATLSPNEKMIRPACIHCHGLEFTLDSLADKKLIEENFKGEPSIHVQSMDLAREDLKRAEKEREVKK